MLVKLLRGFAKVWFALSAILIIGSALVMWRNHGFGRVQEIFSPFNLVNFAAIVLTVSPGLGAEFLARKLDDRARRTRHSPAGT